MKNIIIIAFIVTSLFSCKKEVAYTNDLEGKLKEVTDLKAVITEKSSRVAILEAEIIKLDPSKGIKPKLVSTLKLSTEGFEHFINLQGSVKSENISYVAPRNGMGGYVKNIYVKQGQQVKKGQLLIKLDDSVLKQGINAVKSQLSFAQNLYEKNKALWDQGIGTEVQLLAAKNNVEALQNQIAIQEEQLKTFNVYADQSGIADQVNIKAGELFSGITMAGPQIQIVNNSELSVYVDIPENYASKVKQGAKVVIDVPSIGKSFNSTISRISQSVNVGSRGFTAECKIPSALNLKPNMGASIKILNHSNTKAIVVPVNIVQSDENGKYVYVMVDGLAGKKVTKKINISVGEIYGDEIEVLSGLNSGDVLISQGYQNLYEGQFIAEIK
jgi:membrane fusion protein, multidrug efflux system